MRTLHSLPSILFLVSRLAVRGVVAGAPYCLASDSCFPSDQTWTDFNETVSGKLIKVEPYGKACYAATYDAEQCKFLAENKGVNAWRAQQPAAVMYTNWEQTETLAGCVVPDPLTNGSAPPPIQSECTLGGMSQYVVEVESADDIAAAVRFSAKHNLRFRIKNTGHCYTGRSSGEGSFSIWTHKMNDAKLIKRFVPTGSNLPAQDVISAGPAVDVQGLYQAGGDNGVVTIGGYTPSVGAAGGYIIGGGTGPLGHLMGLGVDNVVQFDVVMADGSKQSANAQVNSDLFWALRGGGGTFAVTTRVYIKAFPPFKAVNTVAGSFQCQDVQSFSALISQLVDLQVPLRNRGQMGIWEALPSSLTVAYLSVRPFTEEPIQHQNQTLEMFAPALAVQGCQAKLGASQFTGSASWNDAYTNVVIPTVAPGGLVGVNLMDTSRIITYDMMNRTDTLQKLKDHITSSTVPVIWQNSVGKAVTEVATDVTAVHPRWREAFAFINEPIFGPWQGIDDQMRRLANETAQRLDAILGHVAYYNEEYPTENNWQDKFWGPHYPHLLSIKKKVDPGGVFSCRQCVGSEQGY